MNNQLTKEECLEAVEYLKRVFYQDSAYAPIVYYYEDGSDYKKMVDVLQQLINEHFANQPLKFEELHEDMWVWDNLVKGYMRIYGKEIKYNEELVEYCCGFIDFEENRFYRYEVKEVKE